MQSERTIFRLLSIERPFEIAFTSRERMPLSPAEIRLRSVLSGISHGTEMNLYRGTTPSFHKSWSESLRLFTNGEAKKTYPVFPGYETVAQVVEVGADCPGVKIGDLAWIDASHGEEHHLPLSTVKTGLLPTAISPTQGIFLALTRVALGGVHDARIHIGDTVTVVGLGTIGLITVQLALRAGASRVFAVDRFPLRLEKACSYGAIGIRSDSDPAREIKELTSGHGTDVAIETSGNIAALQTAIRGVCVGGSVVVVSSYQASADTLFLGEEFHRNRVSIRSSMTVNKCSHRIAPRWNLERLNSTAIGLLQQNQIDVTSLITQVLPFSSAIEAYRLIDQTPGETIKVALSYD
ncbi:MAG TPA: zinc-binding alcohol dehydrogenase [Blastocatellia bacterium]|nr:zinc-binding alcohol dehydrogenase [Blastocatellia bacterium]